MPVTVVVGGQFGSEGKGKVAHFVAREMDASVAVRVGGPNSGHTVINPSGDRLILRQLPTAAILPNVTCVLGAGSYIIPELLTQEIMLTGLDKDRLFIDPHAVVITDEELRSEKESSLRENIGSTQSGTGAAVSRRISRRSEVLFAENDEQLKPFVRSVTKFLRDQLTNNKRVILEGTQGFGLSLLHSSYYPVVTSRDTTASGFLSEAGLSPFDVDDVIMVLRAFPIRVGGNSGHLPEEIDWDRVTAESGSQAKIVEHTSVSKSVRRVAHFSPEVVLDAIRVNKPSRIVLNHVDYIDVTCFGSNSLTEKAVRFVEQVEQKIGSKIDYVGSGPASMSRRFFVQRMPKSA
jgi:adenylosuccinate synthase